MVLDNHVSSAVSVYFGVPQCSVPGPVLFLEYINDMADSLPYSNINLFADDTVIAACVHVLTISGENYAIMRWTPRLLAHHRAVYLTVEYWYRTKVYNEYYIHVYIIILLLYFLCRTFC